MAAYRENNVLTYGGTDEGEILIGGRTYNPEVVATSPLNRIAPAEKEPETERRRAIEPVKVEAPEPVLTFSDVPNQADAEQKDIADKNTILKIAAGAITGTAAGYGIKTVIDLVKKKKKEPEPVPVLTEKTPEEKLKQISSWVGIAAGVYGLLMYLTKK